MLFTEEPKDQAYERMMIGIPNFKPRGHGTKILHCFDHTPESCDCSLCCYYSRKNGCMLERCPCIKERIKAGAATFREMMEETVIRIRSPKFRERLEKYMEESERDPMKYRNAKHEQVFLEAIRKLNPNNNAVLAAVYLLTADFKLWNQARWQVESNKIRFENFKPKSSTENGYVLYCCAKDLCLGTRHITVHDMTDSNLIPPTLFCLICNAMAIRRFGLEVFQCMRGI